MFFPLLLLTTTMMFSLNCRQLWLHGSSDERSHSSMNDLVLPTPLHAGSNTTTTIASSGGDMVECFSVIEAASQDQYSAVKPGDSCVEPTPLREIYDTIIRDMRKCFSEISDASQSPQSVKQCDMNRFLCLFHSNSSMYASYTPNSVKTLLFAACEYGQHQILEYLIKMGASINKKDIMTYSPLHYCAQLGHDKCMRLLLDNGADYTAETEMGKRAIHDAAGFGHLNCVKMLVEYGENVNINYTILVQRCIPGDHVHVLRWLVENGADPRMISATEAPPSQRHHPIHLASQYNAGRCLQYLIDQCGIDVNLDRGDFQTPLFIACSVGAGDVIDVLLKNKQVKIGLHSLFYLLLRDDVRNFMKFIQIRKTDITIWMLSTAIRWSISRPVSDVEHTSRRLLNKFFDLNETQLLINKGAKNLCSNQWMTP